MNRGILLYGGPAAGKDTITTALTRSHPRYTQFTRRKHGRGRSTGYRIISDVELTATQASPDEIVWQNSRYGATYLITRADLKDALSSNQVPVLHLGQPAAIDAVTRAEPGTDWLIVELYCPPDVALARIQQRPTGDHTDRQQALAATPRLTSADLVINTATTAPEQAAAAIHSAFVAPRPAT